MISFVAGFVVGLVCGAVLVILFSKNNRNTILKSRSKIIEAGTQIGTKIDERIDKYSK